MWRNAVYINIYLKHTFSSSYPNLLIIMTFWWHYWQLKLFHCRSEMLLKSGWFEIPKVTVSDLVQFNTCATWARWCSHVLSKPSFSSFLWIWPHLNLKPSSEYFLLRLLEVSKYGGIGIIIENFSTAFVSVNKGL